MESSQKHITKTAMMAAIIFVCTYTFKIPIAITGGYTHLGDCAIFLGVMILGRKNGAIAAALGASMADLLGGFMLWVLPTAVTKGIMAYLMGLIIEKILPGKPWNWLVGELLGGLIQVICYQSLKALLLGPAAALATIPTILAQTTAGIMIGSLLIVFLNTSGVISRLKIK